VREGMRLVCSLYRNEYSNLKLAKATMGRGLGSSEESGKDCNTYMHGNNTGNLSI
jgi:hypothetical protein